MPAKPVQVSIAANGRPETESRLAKAYTGRADAVLEEIVELLGRQAWPNE